MPCQIHVVPLIFRVVKVLCCMSILRYGCVALSNVGVDGPGNGRSILGLWTINYNIRPFLTSTFYMGL